MTERSARVPTPSQADALAVQPALPHRANRFQVYLRRDVGAWLAIALLVGIIGSAIFAPVVAPRDPVRQALSQRLRPPAWADGGTPDHLLGTDQLGRDILSRIIYGARISLIVGFTSVVLSALIGVALGLVTGFYRGWLDDFVNRLIDIQLSVPYMLLAIGLVMVIGPSLWGLILVLVLYGWTVYARLVRAEVLSLREREYVVAARAIGVRDWRIMFGHILPNTLNSIIVVATLEIANMIIFEAGLSFLGLGVQPPTPSWGTMLSDSRDYVPAGAWWLAAFPGLAITLTILAINTLGDTVRDILDPRFRL